jgi:hypothetical protein
LLAATLGIVTGGNPWQAAVAGALFLILFVSLIRAVMRQPFGRGGAPGPLPADSW